MVYNAWQIRQTTDWVGRKMGKVSRALERAGYNSTNGTSTGRSGEGENLTGKGTSASGPKNAVAGGGWDERLTKVTSFSQEIAESFRMVRSRILLPPDGRPVPRSIMVTSALPQEGKSFVAANLALTLAQGIDQYSLLVDCDLRLPTLARLFGVSNDVGLVDFLKHDKPVSELIQKLSVDKMGLLPSGRPPVNPSELLGSVRMHDLVDELAARYEDRFIIYDTPPMNVASESIVLGKAVDAVILVVRQGIAGRPLLERAIENIGRHKILGIIFNGQKYNPLSRRLMRKDHGYYGGYYNQTSS